MPVENKLISSRFIARAAAVQILGPVSVLLCTAFGSEVMAQERVVVDLPLPPAAKISASSGQQRTVLRPTTSSTVSKPVVPAPIAKQWIKQSTVAPSSSTPARISSLTVKIPNGGSLYRVFRKYGLNQGDLISMTRSSDAINKRLRRLRAGQKLALHVTPAGRVARLVLFGRDAQDVIVERQSAERYTMRTLTNPAGLLALQLKEQASSQVEEARSKPIAKPQAIKLAKNTAATAPVVPQQTTPVTNSAPQTESRSRQVKVRSGDSLSVIFNREGISRRDLATLLRTGDAGKSLRRLRPGQELMFTLAPDGTSLISMRFELDETRTFKAIRKGPDSFSARIDTQPLERRVATASAVIENALFLAGQRAGLSDRLIMEMVAIFGWDVDFALDVRAGDRFTVVYEELYKNGEKIRDGNILASEFNNRGRAIRAVRYVDQNDRAEYFSPKGFSMRKAFLRTPVNFRRISSRFNRGRMHPVLQRMRAHKGVDYAAAKGTPIKAAGHGRVVSSGRKGGYGKTVVLQHGGKYTTLYAHMTRIHSRARKGKRVKQGEIIGYVGSTGLATGPHLHYEFRVHGVHKDPLRVKLPKALPIESRYKKDFLRKTAPLVGQLNTLANTSIASSN
ncbi:MAG: murein DD-endopeptidase MepM/ murein hydrolase activator NlpD [Gammaproteobacteria bacterium]|jgi:murein DD-endopeptidase MepM/ murein hydrolase activator NlpD